MSADELQRALARDLDVHGAQLASDDGLCRDLYRALTRHTLRRDGIDGHLSLSFARAEMILNSARGDAPPLELAQTGGEGGEVTAAVRGVLEHHGWSFGPLDTGRADPGHRSQTGAPDERDSEPQDWERQAHAQADAEVERRRP